MSLLRLEIEEFVFPQTYEIEPMTDGVRFGDRRDVLICRCEPALINFGKFTKSGNDEWTEFVGLVDRFKNGSLIEGEPLPAMVNVLWLTSSIDVTALELTDDDAMFVCTGILSRIS